MKRDNVYYDLFFFEEAQVKRGEVGFFFLVACAFLVFFISLPVSWGQPISMGRVELKGKVRVEIGKELVFQSPKDVEAPIMVGSVIDAEKEGRALLDWTGKGTLVLPADSRSVVNDKGLRLERGAVSIRLNPAKRIVIDALDCTFTVIAPPDKAGIAKIAIKGLNVEVHSETAKIEGSCRRKGAFVLLAGQHGVYGPPSILGPVLIGSTAGVLAVIGAFASNKGGGGRVSPYTP